MPIAASLFMASSDKDVRHGLLDELKNSFVFIDYRNDLLSGNRQQATGNGEGMTRPRQDRRPD